MRVLVLFLLALFVSAPVFADEPATAIADEPIQIAAFTDQQSKAPGNCAEMSFPKEEVQMSFFSGPAHEEIGPLCCCQTMNGMCCNHQPLCGMLIPGCLCN